ncbi:L,D-transpeptidase [Chromohalobacter sp. 11-W]|uniref:L,D-transpeptidase n=1 Tax=Chromohalobacter sp. 11-W TaxID=2994061 RepID=UPI0024684686|nr:L,D-transpeptidase [Chromohalobacter sp. 11-W]
MRTPQLADLPPEHGVWLEIDLGAQSLTIREGDVCRETFSISSGENGIGQHEGSGQTPVGWHYVRAAIGNGLPAGSVFRGRRPSGEVFSPELARVHPERDWILTRILWLCGLERGVNRGGDVDSQRRYIYLHGTPADQPMGTPASHGCIRLRDETLLAVFEAAPAGTPVWLHD